MRDDATTRQVEAADPDRSTWLSANAGSGKTRVLTDRVARLLLAGVDPQRILCLTYTKAAASEMQNRLFRRLGAWAMLEEDGLRAALTDLGIAGSIGTDTLAGARRLFARAIETPGGLRIQTIHSFCASLLRRFPLEAGVSPQFTEMDERTARLLRDAVVEEMADSTAPAAVAALARWHTAEDFSALVAELARQTARFQPRPTPEALARTLGLPAGLDEAALLDTVFLGDEGDWMPPVIAALRAGSVNDVKAADRLAPLPWPAPDIAMLAALEGVLLFGADAKAPFAPKTTLPTKATRAALGNLTGPLDALMARVADARLHRVALSALRRTMALHDFAAVFLPAYAAAKAARGWLDFDDLIGRAVQLLTDPSVAQWVLFRLDGGIDHILVDEAQDTSPAQWQVISLLAQEFTAGRGARDTARTIFVVGDKKQSIYSFQGADLATFDTMKAHFQTGLAAAQGEMADLVLEHSFRSSPAILQLVDATFAADGAAGLGGTVRHIAHRPDMPGRVDLWPVTAPAENPDTGEWDDPVDLILDSHHAARLAQQIAAAIDGMIRAGTCIPAPGGPRPVQAGDVLILVQRRSTLFTAIIAACKALQLPIAGADRLKLAAELAVRDLAALLGFLALPEDDLSLAAVLRSPLLGWSEARLYDLAHGRTGHLWAALRERDDAGDTLAMLQDLRDQADFLRPYDLIERALTRHGGRRRLLARLGPEAEDGIDEFLSQALAYERLEVPSLTGFLCWLDTDDLQVKRQADSAGNRIRVMTVHGAKGLEAPVVILPETQDRKPPDGDQVVLPDDGPALWRVPSAEAPAVMVAAQQARAARAAAESLRLLYVAMTRAQSWLIVAAAGKVETPGAWFRLVEQGMLRAGAVAATGGGLHLAHGDWPAPVAAPPPASRAEIRALAPWVSRPATPPEEPVLLSPSDLGGAKVLPGETDPTAEAAARAHGTALHLLLEHLPGQPPALWPELAANLLAGAAPEAIAAALAEAAGVLQDPALAHLFAEGALTEVALTAEVAGCRMLGAIDRLILSPGHLLAVDFKSNRLIPASAAAMPEGVLRQMGAYAAMLRQICPDRQIALAVLWTKGPRLMPVPCDLAMAALQRAAFP